MSAPAPVWVVAGTEAAARWVPALRARGLAAGALCWSTTRALAFDAGALSAADLVLFTSRNGPAALPPGWGAGRDAACVGAGTAEAARERGFDVRCVGSAGGAALAEEVLRALPGVRRVLFLGAAQARPEACEALAAAGLEVHAAAVYTSEPDADFAARVATAPEPRAVVLGSPRAVDALAGALAAAGRALPPGVALVAPGALTAERAAACLQGYVALAPRTDPEGLAEAACEALARSETTGRDDD